MAFVTELRTAMLIPTVAGVRVAKEVAVSDNGAEDMAARNGSTVVAGADDMGRLLGAYRSILGELSLPAVLLRIVECACDLTGARFAALGVVGSDGTLAQFVHTGMSADQVAAIGPLPQGRGLLGALIQHPEPIRVANISADPRSAGFPDHHPPMGSFLGVPIKLRDEIYGHLYLTESMAGEFSQADTDVVVSLAGTAAIAIENARLYEEAQRRQDWLQASTVITRRLLTSTDTAMSDIAEQVKRLAGADVVTVVLPDGDGRLKVALATGHGEAELTGIGYQADRTLSQAAMQTGEPIRLAGPLASDELQVHLSEFVSVGPVMAIPLIGSGAPRGALVVARAPGRPAFSLAELDMAGTFAGHAAVAIELAEARASQDRLILLEDRDRIARDLHDHVIQRLFAAGLTLQSVLSAQAQAQVVAGKLARVVDDIDDTIRQIRTSIFALHGPSTAGPASARAQLMSVVDTVSAASTFIPRIKFTGPIDSVVGAELLPDLQAVVREALTNVSRHAHATTVEIDLTAAQGWLLLDVADDGIGLGVSSRRSGLDNLRRRAEARAGRFEVSSAPDQGTHLHWGIPLT